MLSAWRNTVKVNYFLYSFFFLFQLKTIFSVFSPLHLPNDTPEHWLAFSCLLSVDFSIGSMELVKCRHCAVWVDCIVYSCSQTMTDISVLNGTRWVFAVHCFDTACAVVFRKSPLACTHTWKCCCRWRQQQPRTNIFALMWNWKIQVSLSIGVTQFLLLTAVCDQKINLANKLVYLFLSLALLLILFLPQIGFSYKPERCIFLQPNLKTCL